MLQKRLLFSTRPVSLDWQTLLTRHKPLPIHEQIQETLYPFCTSILLVSIIPYSVSCKMVTICNFCNHYVTYHPSTRFCRSSCETCGHMLVSPPISPCGPHSSLCIPCRLSRKVCKNVGAMKPEHKKLRYARGALHKS
ncbi:hypothetical protein METBIDRAFT_141498 [Metschnikowia bicuspidata var. bicuspidata NRRL YB-4993]|uniref:Uncharacterized protein n=1 Tax=Metschnikowia bicuspidata var. bicuspidata NRRL YB-4993 TaxID=869754 RepID=A0A1A0HDD2_9ASCO|nr:hypothetical protein METBIDRAFT_141498 [Metschnikowia bicuspidata var. bicuspidata NRRL YB-4993]OBA21938.1 hypothetical protein METBIDRAFT_141498 [Metschnikowia bicuspidata var. bicuspidata NRRL YB-4993]